MELWYFYEARRNSQLGKIKIQVQGIRANNITYLLFWQKQIIIIDTYYYLKFLCLKRSHLFK